MIILGSQSPRRKEIFSFFSLPFTQKSPDFDEDSIPFTGNPTDYVCELAEGKALSLIDQNPQATIVTADTIVFCEDSVFGKPKDKKHAFEMLSKLSGKWHTVYTGIAIYHNKEMYSQVEATNVLFNTLTAEQISAYHNAIQWSDKAGGYAIQAGGGMIIKKIDGCFYNVFGFPINTLRELFEKIGIDLWQYLK